jgi:hypothetical protein
MKTCKICGETKEDNCFVIIPFFTKYKKHNKVTWCTICQKLYIDMKKEKEHYEKVVEETKDESIFIVRFD